MSKRLFQGVIHQMKDYVDKIFGVVDNDLTIVACSDLERIGEQLAVTVAIDQELVSAGGYSFKSIPSSQGVEYSVFVEGNDIVSGKYAEILAVSFSNIKNYYDEKYDKSNFVKNIILDNILAGDIYLKARELHFNNDVSRTVLLIRNLGSSDVSVFNAL